MKTSSVFAGLACTVFGVLLGCDASGSNATSSTATGTVAGRVALDSGSVVATDSSGAPIGHARIGRGRFGLHLPEGARFPLVLVADSAGVELCTFVPVTDSGSQDIKLDRLTDSACKDLGLRHGRPGKLDPKRWHDKLDSLRPALDSLVKADSVRHHVADSLRGPKPPRDSLHVHAPRDSARPVDSLRPPHPIHPPVDSLRPPRPVPPVADSLRPRPVPPVADSLHPRPVPPVADSLHPRPIPPVKDSLVTP